MPVPLWQSRNRTRTTILAQIAVGVPLPPSSSPDSYGLRDDRKMDMTLKADMTITSLSVRAEPVQQRSAERITSLLDAAAELIDANGIDGLTTSDVATRSGSSVGVVYRYFPNIQSLLKALAARNLDKFNTRLRELLPEDATDSVGAMNAGIDTYLELGRTEPGFRALRFGDVIEDRFISDEPGVSVGISAMFTELLVTRYGVNSTPELAFDIEVLVEIGDALLHRAFRNDRQGDERFISRLREIVRDFIVSHDVA